MSFAKCPEVREGSNIKIPLQQVWDQCQIRIFPELCNQFIWMWNLYINREFTLETLAISTISSNKLLKFLRGHWVGPSTGEDSGLSWTSIKIPSTPTAAQVRAIVGIILRSPPLATPPSPIARPAGCWSECVISANYKKKLKETKL